MLVNLGLPATAAAAHKHEFSAQTQKKQKTTQPSALSLPFRLMSATIRETPSSPVQQAAPRSVSGTLPPPGSTAFPPPSAVSSSPYLSTTDVGSDQSRAEEVGEEDGLVVVSADDDDDYDTRTLGGASSKHHRQRRLRPKTSFRFAHPAPSGRPKRLRIRPRLLLQLQHVSQTSRPVPTLDVIPSATRFGPLSVGRRRRVSDVVLAKDRIPATDLLVVVSDSHEPAFAPDDDTRSVSSDDEPDSGHRRIATLCHGRKENSNNNSNNHNNDVNIKGVVTIHEQPKDLIWSATLLPRGGYEFTHWDEHGVSHCIRWVLRPKGSRPNLRAAAAVGGNDARGRNDDHRRFTFSVIDPRTRRHPIVAWMSKSGIDILDQCAPSPPRSPLASQESGIGMNPAPKSCSGVIMNEKLRALILTTGIWIAFREGWSENPLMAESSSSPAQQQPQQQQPQQLPPTSSLLSPHSKWPASPGGLRHRRSAEKGIDTSTGTRSSFQQVGTRLLGLQRSVSSTAESWRSAHGPDDDSVTVARGDPKTGHEADDWDGASLTKAKESESARCGRRRRRGRGLSLSWNKDKNKDETDERDAKEEVVDEGAITPSYYDNGRDNGQGYYLPKERHANNDGLDGTPAKSKKKKRLWSHWLEIGPKRKPR